MLSEHVMRMMCKEKCTKWQKWRLGKLSWELNEHVNDDGECVTEWLVMMWKIMKNYEPVKRIYMVNAGGTIPGGPKKHGTVDFLGLCSDQQLSFFTLLDRASFPHYNNTKIIKFGWELFILWVISYGLSFSGFAINLSLIVPRNSGNRANPENDSP